MNKSDYLYYSTCWLRLKSDVKVRKIPLFKLFSILYYNPSFICETKGLKTTNNAV